AALERLADQLAARPVELDADHHALAAHLLDAAQPGQRPRQRVAQMRAYGEGVVHQLFFGDDLQGGERGTAGERIATEGRAVLAGCELARGLARCQASADRHAAAE